MFITPEKIGHLKTSDIASLMKTAVRAMKLVYKHTDRQQFQTQFVKAEVKRKWREGNYNSELGCKQEVSINESSFPSV